MPLNWILVKLANYVEPILHVKHISQLASLNFYLDFLLDLKLLHVLFAPKAKFELVDTDHTDRYKEESNVEYNDEGDAADDSPASFHLTLKAPNPVREGEQWICRQQNCALVDKFLHILAVILVRSVQQQIVSDKHC